MFKGDECSCVLMVIATIRPNDVSITNWDGTAETGMSPRSKVVMLVL